MKNFFTLILCFFTLSLTAQVDCQGPDFNNDGVIGAADIIVFLTYDGNEWPPEVVFTGCGDLGSDLVSHEGYDYSTVIIGEQCWFAENCRYLPAVSSSSASSEAYPLYYVYGYEGTDVASAQATTNYETYGVLYNWPAVMTEGICPSEWHIPSDGEWTQFSDFLGGESVAGSKMKDDVQWNGSNSSGFTGLPGGFCHCGVNCIFANNGGAGDWWSSSESSSDSWFRELSNAANYVVSESLKRSHGFSARCVRD